MNIKVANLKSGMVNIHIHHSYKLSEGGFYHIPFILLSIGKEGIAIHILGLSVGIGWKE